MAKSKSIGLNMFCQETDFWCWAAVTQAIDMFKGKNTTQEAVATKHVSFGTPGVTCSTADLPQPTSACATTGCTGPCNSPHRLSQVFLDCGHQVQAVRINTLTFQDIVQIIESDSPLPLRMNIPSEGDGGHFICVVGYSDDGQGNEFVEVLDPLVPGIGQGQATTRDIPFDSFIDGTYTINGASSAPNYRYNLL